MAIPTLIVRSLTRAAIPRMFRAGMSANAAAEFMRGQVGSLYRRTEFLADWREITGVEKIKESFKYIPKKYRLSFGLTVPRATPMATNFQYLYRIVGFDPEAKAMTYRWVSMLDDVRMAPERAEAIMSEKLLEPDKYPDKPFGLEGWEVELFVAYRNPLLTEKGW